MFNMIAGGSNIYFVRECLSQFTILLFISLELHSVLSSPGASSLSSPSISEKKLNDGQMTQDGKLTNQIDNNLQMDSDVMMDSKFDFHFNWDEEPPEFISQLDLEVKWEDEEHDNGNKGKMVSIHNVTMNQDYDITGPMTKLITSMANTSFHEERQNKMMPASSTTKPVYQNENAPNSNKTNVNDGSTNRNGCSCEEIHSIIADLQNSMKGDMGRKKEGKKGRGRKRSKGDKGQKGEPGLSIVGPKGEPGDPGLLPYHLMHSDTSRLKGEPGPPGPPGYCSSSCPKQNSASEPANIQNSRRERAPTPKKHHYRIVPGALVFKTKPTMFQMSTYVMAGSVVFVEDSEEFYGKVKGGWRKFQMGSLEMS